MRSPPSRPTFSSGRKGSDQSVTWSVNSGGTLWGAASAAGGWWGHRGTQLRRRRRSWSGERASSSSTGPRARGSRRLRPASPSCPTRRFPSDRRSSPRLPRPKGWGAASSLSKPGWGVLRSWAKPYDCGQLKRKAAARDAELYLRGPDAQTSQCGSLTPSAPPPLLPSPACPAPSACRVIT